MLASPHAPVASGRPCRCTGWWAEYSCCTTWPPQTAAWVHWTWASMAASFLDPHWPWAPSLCFDPLRFQAHPIQQWLSLKNKTTSPMSLNHVPIYSIDRELFYVKKVGRSTNYPSDLHYNLKYIFGHKLSLSKKKTQQYLSCKTLIFSYVFIALHLKINIV